MRRPPGGSLPRPPAANASFPPGTPGSARLEVSPMRSLAACTSLLAAIFLGGCATTGVRIAMATARSEVGLASHYAHRFEGHRTASGEPYDERELTGAHRTLPFGTRVRVTNLDNHRSVVVRIN